MAEERTGLYVGFVDYHFNFLSSSIVATVLGTIILVCTIVSHGPQPFTIIQKRSNYGLAGASVFSSSMSFFCIMFNVLCLKFSDLVGAMQYPFASFYPVCLTFITVFIQYALFTSNIFLNIIFYDDTEHKVRYPTQIFRAWSEVIRFGIMAICSFLMLILVWIGMGMLLGFDSYAIKVIGIISGFFALGIPFVEYVPQIWMTYKLGDHGSLSLLMLKIQAPTNLANGFFMWLVQGEDWSTYAAAMVDALFEFALLLTCYINIWKKMWHPKRVDDDEIGTAMLENLDPLAAMRDEAVPSQFL